MVAILWPIDDLSAAALMGRTAQLETEGIRFESAFSTAVRWLRAAPGADLAAALAAPFAALANDRLRAGLSKAPCSASASRQARRSPTRDFGWVI